MAAIAAKVRALSPFGPIFGKELRVTARRKRSYLLRVSYLTALLLVLAMVWSETRVAYGPGNAAARAQAQEQLGQAFFYCFVAFTTVAMLIIGPILTATAISSERLGRTLNVLLVTPITAWQIVGGKLGSRLLVAITLIGLSLPVLALSRLLGGLELAQMIGGLCVPATAAVFAAAVGLLLSTVLRRAFAVILLAYAVLGFVEMFVPFVGIVAFRIGDRPGGEQIWANVNLFGAMTAVMSIGGRGTVGTVIDPWMVGCAVHLAMATGLVVFSGVLLRRISRREDGGAAGVDPSENIPIAATAPETLAALDAPAPPPLAPTASAQSPGLLAYSTPVRPGGSRPDRTRDVPDNPVLWRELRRPLTSRRWQARLFAILSVALLLTSYAVVLSGGGSGLRDPDAQIGYAIIFHGLLWLLVAVVSATSVAQEKESDTWTLLLTTPITGRSIVFGKAAGLLRRLMWPYVLAVGHLALFTVLGVIRPEAFALALWVLVTFNSIWIATGIYLSLRMRTVTFAVILNLLLAMIAYPGMALSLLLGGELLSSGNSRSLGRDPGGRWAEQVMWYLPYSYIAIGMNGIERSSGASAIRWYGDLRFELPCDPLASPPEPGASSYNGNYYQRRVNFLQFAGVVMTVGLLYVMASFALLLWTAQRFDRIVGRAKQIEKLSPPAPARGMLPSGVT
jgi:ABC-type transport system involved in multi-copper enzyme maturation permease subunit